MGFEPMTCCLRNSCSTPELHWRADCESRNVWQKNCGRQAGFHPLSCRTQKRKRACDQKRKGLVDLEEFRKEGVKEDGGHGVFVRVGFEGEAVAVVEDAAEDVGAGRRVDGKAQGADGDFAIVADAHGGAQAPYEAPPGAGWRGADAGVFLGESGVVGGVGGGGEVPVEFVMKGEPDAMLGRILAPAGLSL